MTGPLNGPLLEALNGSLSLQYMIAVVLFLGFLRRKHFALSEAAVLGGFFIAVMFAGEAIYTAFIWIERVSINRGLPVSYPPSNMTLMIGGALRGVGIVGVIYVFAGAAGFNTLKWIWPATAILAWAAAFTYAYFF